MMMKYCCYLVLNVVFFFPGEAVAAAQRVEREDGELHPQHQLHHLRRDPAGDEEGQGVPGALRQGGRLQEPGTKTAGKTAGNARKQLETAVI